MRFGAPAWLALVFAVALLCAPRAGRAHEATYQLERGRAIALRAVEEGEGMAGASWQVFSPADPTRPHQEGKTDPQGWLAFVPDAPGRWRVRVVEDDGHGLDVQIDAGAPAAPPAAAPLPGGGWARGLAGLAVVGVAFAALWLTYRRREGLPGT